VKLLVLEPRRTANVQQQLIKELKVRNKMGIMDKLSIVTSQMALQASNPE
jgi:hypothetical protein